MAKKRGKRAKKKKLNTVISSDEQTKLDGILESLQCVDPSHIQRHITTPLLASLILEKLPPDKTHSRRIMLAIREAFPDEKCVQKSLKRALFKLRQKGVSIPELEEPRETKPLITDLNRVEPIAYIGPPDGAGNRPLLIGIPRFPKGYDVGIGIANDERGFREFIAGIQSKKRMNELKAFFLEQVRDPVETSTAHVAQILETTYERQEPTATEGPASGYLKIRPRILEEVTIPQRPVVYDFISPEDVSKALLTDSQINRLLDHRLMETWIVDPEAIQPVLEDVQKVKESPILISDGQRARRIEEIKAEGISKIYPDEKKALLKRRLEELAFIFVKRGEGQYAKTALAAAISLDENDSAFRVNPFLAALIDRSIQFYLESSEEEGGSDIVPGHSPPSIIMP